MSRFSSFRLAYISAAGLGLASVSNSQTVAKLASFLLLPNGWHYGRGGAIQHETISLAQKFISIFSEFDIQKTDAFPGVDGEIMITGYTDHDYYEIVISALGEISILREADRVENFSQGDLDEKAAAWQLRELLGDKCTTSGYFIQNTSTLRETNLKVWPSRTTMVAHLSSNENVWIQRPLPSANIFESFIQTPEVIPPSSGFFLRMRSHQEVH